MVGFAGEPATHVSLEDLDARVKQPEYEKSVDKSGYGTRERSYEDHGDFSMVDQSTMKFFGELFENPENCLDSDRRGAKVADGGYNQTMSDVNHESPIEVEKVWERGYKEE